MSRLAQIMQQIARVKATHRGRSFKSLRSHNYGVDDLAVAASTIMTKEPNKSTDLSYVETDFRDYIVNQFVMGCIASHTHIFCDESHFDVVPNMLTITATVLSDYKYEYTIVASSDTRAQIIVGTVGIVSVRTSSNSTYVDVTGSQKLIDDVLGKLRSMYDEITTSVEWMISGDGNTITVPLYTPHGIGDSSYPFVEEGVEQFVDDFLNSTENVLLLIGEPGTGKSNFCKYIIARSKRNALITYDPEIMKKDGIFAQFIEGDAGSLIFEDADQFLGARTEGNPYMSKILNVGDGLVSMKGKKIIFSTNLPNLDDVDPALLRPGRCRGVIQFRKLTHAESVAWCSDHNVTAWSPTSGEDYSLAELYSHARQDTKQNRQAVTKQKVGFY
jgi:hypothetical protein